MTDLAPGRYETLSNEGDLPDHLRARIDRSRASVLHGRVERVGSALKLEDGSLWFADGVELSLTTQDELRLARPALGFLGAVALGAFAAYRFSESDVLAWAWTAGALLLAGGGVAAAVSNMSRGDAAAARMALGTLLLEDTFVYLSHGRAVAIPRNAVSRTALVNEGRDKDQVRVIYFRRAQDGRESMQRITGFFRDDVGVEQLRRWIAGPPREERSP